MNSLSIGTTQIGSADCILIEDRGIVTLVDTGTGYKISTDKIINYLKDLNITKIDNLFLTHGHDDHVGGVPAIVDAFDIVNAYYTTPKDWSKIRPCEVDWKTRENSDLAISALVNKVNSDGTYVNLIVPDEEGKVYKISDDSYFTVYNCLAAVKNNYREPEFNDFSMMMKYTYKNVSALLTGDINIQYEYVLNGEVDKNGNRVAAGSAEAIAPVGEIAIFKLPHHGTEGSLTTEKTLAQFNPYAKNYLSVITGHIANVGVSTYPRLEKFGYQHRCTQTDGDVVIFTDGETAVFEN